MVPTPLWPNGKLQPRGLQEGYWERSGCGTCRGAGVLSLTEEVAQGFVEPTQRRLAPRKAVVTLAEVGHTVWLRNVP